MSGAGHDRAAIEAIVHGCVRHAGLRAAYVSMTCTRGRMPPGSRDLRTARSMFYCYAVPFIWISRPDQQERGASMRVSQVTRIPSQSVDPSVKNYHWLDLDLALLDAYDHDAELVVLRDLSGAIAEGAGYNVFAHVDGRWLTPGAGTLAGITRRSLIELAREAGQQVDEGRLTAGDLLRSDEVLVTSTAGGIMPVTVIDGTPVGPGHAWAADDAATGPVLGQPPGPAVLHPGALPGTGVRPDWNGIQDALGLGLRCRVNQSRAAPLEAWKPFM